jgi:hypothetical protein
VDLNTGTIKIEQRVWHQDLDRPKSENSRRLLGIGDLVERYRAKLAEDGYDPDTFVFQQKRAPGGRSGTLESVMPFTGPPEPKAAIFPASGRIPSAGPISLGGSR